jgi:serine/threonine protein kinase
VVHEALFWKHLDHPNILPLLGVSQAVTAHLSLVTPWMPNGNIINYLEQYGLNVNRLALVRLVIPATLLLSPAFKQIQVAQCARGLEYLHNYKPALVHGDIKGVSIVTHGPEPFTMRTGEHTD